MTTILARTEYPALSRGLDESGPYDRQGKIVHISREHKKILCPRQWLAGSADGLSCRQTVSKYAALVESCKERQQDCKESLS